MKTWGESWRRGAMIGSGQYGPLLIWKDTAVLGGMQSEAGCNQIVFGPGDNTSTTKSTTIANKVSRN